MIKEEDGRQPQAYFPSPILLEMPFKRMKVFFQKILFQQFF